VATAPNVCAAAVAKAPSWVRCIEITVMARASLAFGVATPPPLGHMFRCGGDGYVLSRDRTSGGDGPKCLYGSGMATASPLWTIGGEGHNCPVNEEFYFASVLRSHVGRRLPYTFHLHP
jgi:hypothetical protein